MDDLSVVVGESAAEGYKTLVEAMPNGVLVLFDAALRYRIVGPEKLPFSGRAAASMVGKTIHELFPEDATATLEPELRATIDGDARSFDMAYDGRIHHVETEPVTIDGEPFGVLVTQNVTEERAMTEALAEKSRRLEAVAGVLSHDLRSPLNVALGHLEAIPEGDDDQQESIETIRRALTRMNTIVKDALILARNTEISEVEPIDLRSHAEATWARLATADATLRVEDTHRLEADPGLFGNLLENLFANAISHGGPDVTVRVGPLDDRAGFYIADDGLGIDPAIRESVFDAGVSTGTDEDHSGLGLAIVAAIVDAHGWSIAVTDAPSGGARFEIDTGGPPA